MRNANQNLLSVLILLSITYSSCSSLYGIYTPGQVRKKVKLSEASNQLYNYNINHYREFSNEQQSINKDLLQPLQFWVITKNKVLCNKVNCHAGGFPNLRWNLERVYADRKCYSSIADSVSYLRKYFYLDGIYIDGSEKPVQIKHFQSADTTVVICFSFFMGRQNRRFLEEVKTFLNNHPSIKPEYIRMDGYYQYDLKN